MREFGLFEGLRYHYMGSTSTVLAIIVSVCRMLFNALLRCTLGQTVNRTSSFMLAGIVTLKLVKSPLLEIHASLCAQLQAFNWEELVRLIQTQRHPVWQSSKIITTTRHGEKLWCQQMSSASIKRPHKKMPLRKCQTFKVKISHNEKLEAQFNFA